MSWAFDFELSFNDPSPGRSTQSVVDAEGKRVLGSSIWKAADDAINQIHSTLPAGDWGTPPAAVSEAIPVLAGYVRDFLESGFRPFLLEMNATGKLTLLGANRDELDSLWDEYGVADRARLFLQSMEQFPLALAGVPELEYHVKSMAALCVLLRTNDAAISAFFDGDGLDDNAADVQWFHRHLSLQRDFAKLFDQARVQAGTESAQARSADLRAIASRPRGTGKDVTPEQVAAFFQAHPDTKRTAVAEAAASAFGTTTATIYRRLKVAREKNLLS